MQSSIQERALLAAVKSEPIVKELIRNIRSSSYTIVTDSAKVSSLFTKIGGSLVLGMAVHKWIETQVDTVISNQTAACSSLLDKAGQYPFQISLEERELGISHANADANVNESVDSQVVDSRGTSSAYNPPAECSDFSKIGETSKRQQPSSPNKNHNIRNDSNSQGNNNTSDNNKTVVGMTLGGLVIKEKVKQKKRMKPSLVSSAVTGSFNNINGGVSSASAWGVPLSSSVFGSQESSVDILAEFKSSLQPGKRAQQHNNRNSDNKKNGVTEIDSASASNAGAIVDNGVTVAQTSSLSLKKQDVVIASNNTETAVSAVNSVFASSPPVVEARIEDDIKAIEWMVDLYVSLVAGQQQQQIHITQVLTLLSKIVGVYIPSDDSFPFSVTSIVGSDGQLTYPTLLTSKLAFSSFQRRFVEGLVPLIRCCGSEYVAQIVNAASTKHNFSASSRGKFTKLVDAMNIEMGSAAGFQQASHNTVYFRLPESFVKPFREELDSRNEYNKSQLENAIYNERERCYDEFSNLLYRFQSIFKSDVDGSRTYNFFQQELPAAGVSVLSLHDCNYTWFADMFKSMLLFYGVNSGHPSSHGVASCSGTTGTGTGSNHSGLAEGGHSTTFKIVSEKQFKLEERLGAGGGSLAGAVAFNQDNDNDHNNNTNNNKKPPTLAATIAAAQSKSSGGKGKGLGSGGSTGDQLKKSSGSGSGGGNRKQSNCSNTNTNVGGYPKGGGTAASAAANSKFTSADLFAEPSSAFYGILQFFFRFIITQNNHRFNQCLSGAISAEIATLSSSTNKAGGAASGLNENRSTATTAGVNSGSGFSGGNTGVSASASDNVLVGPNSEDSFTQNPSRRLFFGADGVGGVGAMNSVANQPSLDSSVSSGMMSPSEFALRVTQLRILGLFLGVLTFQHQWTLIARAVNSRPLKLLANESAQHRADSIDWRAVIPVENVLRTAWQNKTLSFTLPWVVGYLGMMAWDSAIWVRNVHINSFALLKAIQHSPLLSPLDKGFTPNRLFCLTELQRLWVTLPSVPHHLLTVDTLPSLGFPGQQQQHVQDKNQISSGSSTQMNKIGNKKFGKNSHVGSATSSTSLETQRHHLTTPPSLPQSLRSDSVLAHRIVETELSPADLIDASSSSSSSSSACPSPSPALFAVSPSPTSNLDSVSEGAVGEDESRIRNNNISNRSASGDDSATGELLFGDMTPSPKKMSSMPLLTPSVGDSSWNAQKFDTVGQGGGHGSGISEGFASLLISSEIGIDDGQHAFTTLFRHRVAPFMEQACVNLKAKNTQSKAVASAVHALTSAVAAAAATAQSRAGVNTEHQMGDNSEKKEREDCKNESPSQSAINNDMRGRSVSLPVSVSTASDQDKGTGNTNAHLSEERVRSATNGNESISSSKVAVKTAVSVLLPTDVTSAAMAAAVLRKQHRRVIKPTPLSSNSTNALLLSTANVREHNYKSSGVSSAGSEVSLAAPLNQSNLPTPVVVTTPMQSPVQPLLLRGRSASAVYTPNSPASGHAFLQSQPVATAGLVGGGGGGGGGGDFSSTGSPSGSLLGGNNNGNGGEASVRSYSYGGSSATGASAAAAAATASGLLYSSLSGNQSAVSLPGVGGKGGAAAGMPPSPITVPASLSRGVSDSAAALGSGVSAPLAAFTPKYLPVSASTVTTATMKLTGGGSGSKPKRSGGSESSSVASHQSSASTAPTAAPTGSLLRSHSKQHHSKKSTGVPSSTACGAPSESQLFGGIPASPLRLRQESTSSAGHFRSPVKTPRTFRSNSMGGSSGANGSTNLQPPMSPSPSVASTTDGQQRHLFPSSQQQHHQILERLEISFWNQHVRLHQMASFSLAHTNQACLAHVKERTGVAARQLMAVINTMQEQLTSHRSKCSQSISSSSSSNGSTTTNTTNTTSTAADEDPLSALLFLHNLLPEPEINSTISSTLERAAYKVLTQAMQECTEFVNGFYLSFINSSLPQMCQLYPSHTRVVKMAVYFMQKQAKSHSHQIIQHFRAYCYRKIMEVCELSVKNFVKVVMTPSKSMVGLSPSDPSVNPMSSDPDGSRDSVATARDGDTTSNADDDSCTRSPPASSIVAATPPFAPPAATVTASISYAAAISSTGVTRTVTSTAGTSSTSPSAVGEESIKNAWETFEYTDIMNRFEQVLASVSSYISLESIISASDGKDSSNINYRRAPSFKSFFTEVHSFRCALIPSSTTLPGETSITITDSAPHVVNPIVLPGKAVADARAAEMEYTKKKNAVSHLYALTLELTELLCSMCAAQGWDMSGPLPTVVPLLLGSDHGATNNGKISWSVRSIHCAVSNLTSLLNALMNSVRTEFPLHERNVPASKGTSCQEAAVKHFVAPPPVPSQSVLSARAQEATGKVHIETAKYFTAISPFTLFLDCVLATTQSSSRSSSSTSSVYTTKDLSAVRHLELLSSAVCSGSIDTAEVLENRLPSDVFFCKDFSTSSTSSTINSCGALLISAAGVGRALTLVARPKTRIYYDTCKKLVGMRSAAGARAVMLFVSRYLAVHGEQAMGLSTPTSIANKLHSHATSSGAYWFMEPSVRALVQLNAEEEWPQLIATLHKGVTE